MIQAKNEGQQVKVSNKTKISYEAKQFMEEGDNDR